MKVHGIIDVIRKKEKRRYIMSAPIIEQRMYTFETPKSIVIGDPSFLTEGDPSVVRKYCFTAKRGVKGSNQNRLLITEEGGDCPFTDVSIVITDGFGTDEEVVNLITNLDAGFPSRFLSKNVRIGVDTAELYVEFNGKSDSFKLLTDGDVGMAQSMVKGKRSSYNLILIRLGFTKDMGYTVDDFEKQFSYFLGKLTRLS